MTVEGISIDHVCEGVSNLRASEEFYDHVIGVIGFRERRETIGGIPASANTTGTTATR